MKTPLPLIESSPVVLVAFLWPAATTSCKSYVSGPFSVSVCGVCGASIFGVATICPRTPPG